jgi:NAD(P)-dependent dehydrogenase (short-subunit alcohol dehydrogenase family)
VTTPEQRGVAIVTGSTVGIGRAMAEEFARNGWSVVVNARTAADVDAVVAEISAAGGANGSSSSLLGVAADVTDPEAVRAMVGHVVETLGPIDVLVNNAGIPGPRVFAQDVPADEFLEVLRVNL